ncbi:MAG: site-specific DNA-methyltransferase, partial [Anaerolineaceae bacterium]|nr:site-specific DNA-methyltransferase [Anaerolineaceae bacterium]
MSFHAKLTDLLKTEPRFVDDDGELVLAAVQDRAWKMDRDLVKLLLSDKEIKAKFFDEIEEHSHGEASHWIFNTNTFIDYILQKNFLDNSYTRFRNRIGLTIGDKYLRERGDVALVWPYKDTVLEGGQTQEEEKRKEIFFNEVLAQDEINRLLDPKVLTNFARYTAKTVIASDRRERSNLPASHETASPATRARSDIQFELFESWENTVERIFTQNEDNLLLEFTATHDYATPVMVDKYRNKVINRYDLLQFRNDLFSKDVVIVQSDFVQRERILQALILNQYKQEVAAKYRINLKPVILFKAQRTIAQSQENKANFHKIMDGLTAKQIASIRKSDIPIIQRAFQFFDENNISDGQLVERLKREFHKDFCLSVNEEMEKEKYQILLNSLEDKNNRVRAIFAVQKLNEGWDVLNLFDIVRCYEARDTGRAKIGTSTMSEAQLIGRGARYFPFVLAQSNDRFRRKFDGDLTHELRVLEELHYHSINDSRYIAEIRRALIEQGMMDEREVTRELKLKESFKKTQFYKYGIVWLNDRRPKDYQRVRSFADLGVKKRNYTHFIATGHGGEIVALANNGMGQAIMDETRRDVKVRDIERNIVQAAIARNPFFTFASIRKYFPHLDSMKTFVASEDYLGGLEITFQGNVYGLDETRIEKLTAMSGLLSQIESEIRANITDYEGTRDFRRDWVREIFKDKVLKFDPHN